MSTLALTTSADSPRWEEAYEDLAYTAFALTSQGGDPALAQRTAEARAILADWEQIDGDRRRLRGDAIAARAAVRISDAALDLALVRLADAVLNETLGERAELYARYFPEPHERIVALGLDAELPIAALALARLDDGEEPERVTAETEPLRRCVAAGNQALTARAEAYAALGRLEARVEAWHEAASAFGHGLREELAALGEARGLPSRWAACFFPEPRRRG